MYFYVNGEMDKNIKAIPPIDDHNTLPLMIGMASTGNGTWKGLIDEVSMWSRPLNQKDAM